MAKKKKRYGYKDGDENARFAPGGSAASEWEEEQRQSFTMGRTINPSDTSKRFNTEQDIENYKPIKTETYQSYMAQKLAQAKANNPKSRVHVTANDLSSYSNARAKLFNIDPTAELKSQSEFTSQYKSSVDKKARLNDMVQLAQGLDINNAQDLVRKSYNDLGAVKGLANTRTNAEGLLKRVEEYRKLYGDSKELKVLEDRAKGIADYINTNAKGGSAVSNEVFEEAQAPAFKSMYDTKTQTKQDIEAKYNAINNANIEEKYGRPGDLGYEGVKNIKAETPAEADWKEEKQLQLDPFKKYEDNKKEIESLENDGKMPLGNQNGVGYQDDQKVKNDRINALREQNAQILSQYAEDIIAKANLTDDERRKLETGRSFDLSDNEFRWDIGDKAKNEVTLNRKEMIDVLTKRGISEEEASLLLDYENELDKENERQAAINAGELRRRTDSEVGNLTEDIARTIGQPIISPLEKVMGVSGEYAHAEQLGRQQAREKYYEDDAIGKALYDFGETAGTIVGSSLLGGAAAVPFTTKAVEDSYYNALDKGASESDAMNYAATNGIMTGIIYGIGLKGVNKLLSKSVKGSVVEGLAKEIVEGKPTSSLGKAILKNVGTNAVKEGGIFAGLTTTTQVADTLNQVINLGKKSDFNQMVEAYKQQGMSEDEAWQNTVLDISKQIGQGAVESFASGAIMGAGGALIGGARQAKTYNEMRDRAETLKGEYEKFTADTTSPYFENVTDQAELESQYRQRAKELHPDVAEGNEEAFNQLVQDKQRIEGILTGERSNEARTAIDNWENFVNQARDILGLERVLTTKEREKFAEDFADTKTKLLEVRDKLKSETPKSETEAAEIEEVVSNIDNEIARVDTAVEATADIVVPKENAIVEQPTEIVEPTYTEPTEVVETPTERAENVDLSNLNDRQSEIAEIGAEYDLPEKAIKSMVANDNAQISPRLYANEYSKMYLLGKQETIDSIEDAIRRNPEVRDTIARIGTQAAGSAFSEGNTPSIETILRPETKPKGRLAVDFQETLEEAKVHQVLSREAKASGIDIVVTDDMTKYTNQGKAQGIAFLNNGKIVLNRDVANILGTADHEILGHFGKALAPKAYKELASIIVDTYQKDLGIRGYDKFIQNLKSEAKEQGIYLTESDAQEEAIAYGLETMAMNTDAMEKFIDRLQDSTMTEAEKKTILDKLKEFVKHVIETLKQRLKDARVRTGTESMLKADIDAEKVAEAKLKVYEEIRTNLESMTEGEVSDTSKYSLTEIKDEYQKAFEEKDEKKAAELVKEYAAKKGYTQKVYHGTKQFGFTQIDLDQSDDGMTFWATDSLETATTYSDRENVRRINETYKKEDLQKLNTTQLDNLIFTPDSKFEVVEKDNTNRRNEILDNSFNKFFERAKERKREDHEVVTKVRELYNDWKNNKNNTNTLKEYAKNNRYATIDSGWVVDKAHGNLLNKVSQLFDNNNKLFYDNEYDVLYDYNKEELIRRLSEEYQPFGNYEFYANTEDFNVIDAKGKNWSNIEYNEPILSKDAIEELYKQDNPDVIECEYIQREDVYVVTYDDMGETYEQEIDADEMEANFKKDTHNLKSRQLAIISRAKGYEGLLIRNVKDHGGSKYDDIAPADVYIFFNPTAQVKSADPFTYDDNGDLVPLNKRFNKNYDDIRYSMQNNGQKLSDVQKQLSTDYNKAVADNDTEQAAKLVEQYAKSKGYTERVYHGTRQFGFTQIDTQPSEKQAAVRGTFFATTSDKMAQTYSGEYGSRAVSEERNNMFSNLSNKQLSKELKKYKYDFKFLSNGTKAPRLKFAKEQLKELLDTEYANTRETALSEKINKAYKTFTKDSTKANATKLKNLLSNNNLEGLYFSHTDEAIAALDVFNRDKEDIFMFYRNNGYQEVTRQEVEQLLDTEVNKAGNYVFYANTDDFVEVDAKGKHWNELRYHRKKTTSNDIARLAKQEGYNGVLFKNVIDEGAFGVDYYGEPADVYAFFNPVEQVKSADPITYDDNGNVIPLAERFSKDHDDIRYSMANEGRPLSEVVDSEGNELSEQQQEYFKDSKVRDDKGNLQVVYHLTDSNFTKIDFKKTADNLFWFASNKEDLLSGEVSANGTRNKANAKIMELYANITNPAGREEYDKYGIDQLKYKGYDGVILEDGNNFVGFVFNESNQIKNIDNKQPTTNEDIRLSLKEEVTDRDIERFKAIKEDLGNVLRITKGSKLDTQDTRKMALQLKKNWNVKYNTELMTDELKTIGRLIETKGIQNTDTTDYIKAFVTDVLKSETVVDDNTKAFNSYVRNHKIYLSPRDREQITDYNEFRKSAMGSMRLTTSKEGALSVDEFYEHIKDNYPEYYSTIFDEQYPDSSNLPDLLEWIKTAREGTNLLDMYGDEALDFYTQDVIGAYTNAKVEDITNSKAKRNKLLKDVGEMVDTIEGLNKTKDTANQNLLDQMRKLQSDINQRLDRQRENIVNQYEEKMKDIEAKLENEKNENVKRIKQIKEKQKERERRQADSRKRTQQRQVIRRTRDRLKTTINKPTIHKYIPIPLQKGVKDLFNSIDLGEQFTTARLNKMRDNAMIRYTGERLEQELANIDKKEQAFNNSLKEFRNTLDKYINGQLEYANGEKMKPQGDADTYYKPILNMIDNTIEKIGSTSLMKMDLSQLKEVSKTLRAIEKATTERRRPQTIQLKDENGKVLDDYEKISRLAMNQTKKLSKLTNSLLSYQMTGHNTMLAMGGFNPNSIMGQLADDIDQAYIVESKIKQDLNSIWDKVLNIKEGRTNLTMKSEVAQRYNKDDLVDVGFKDIEGKPILLNHDSLIWEYLNLESDDNLTHAARGGISFPDYKKLYGRKSNTQVYSDATRRTFNVDAELKEIQQQINDAYELEDYDKVAELAKNQANILEGRKNELRQIRRNIYKQLTDYDKKVVKAWKEIRDLSTDMLNKYWLKTYGFENFNEEAYWRIVTNPNFIKGSDSGNLQQVITNLSESGSTIARLEGAGNPIISGSALFAVDEYINNTAKLIAYSGLQRDLNAVMRYTIDGYNNLQQKVQENAPKLAENFVTFQQALFGGGTHKEGSRFIATTRGLAARATLSPNLRVALAQVPSFLGTYRYTDAKAIKNAWLPKNRVKQSVIDKYTPLMYARGASGYSLETSDLRQDTNKFLRTLNKADRAVGGWLYQIPNKMDSWTVRHTFGAYLDYARRNYNLEEGTKEQIENGESPLYKKAAELFNEGTLRTQPMFNAFNKNVLQLDDSELKKTLTIFHTQPFQYFNLALQDIMEYKYEVETNGKDSAKAKKARRRALKGIAAILGGTALFTLIKIGVDKTIRHKKDDVDPEDVAEQLISSMANMFVLGSTLVDSIYALITKKKQIFDFEIYGTQIINSLIDFAKATSNVIEGKDVNYAYHITNILSNLGIPVANIEKDLGGIYRNIEDYMDNGMRDYSNEMTDKELLQEYILGNKSKDDLKDLGVEIEDKTKFSNAVKKLYSDGEIDKDTAIKVMEDSGLYNDPKRKQSSSSYIEGKLEWWDIYNKYHDDYINGDSNEKASIRSKIALLPISNYYYHSKTNPHKRIVEYIKNNWKKTE